MSLPNPFPGPVSSRPSNILRLPPADRNAHEGGSLRVPTLTESLWNSSSIGMRLTDEQGLIVAVNGAFCKQAGKSEFELVGTPFFSILGNCRPADSYARAYRICLLRAAAGPLLETDFTISGKKDRHFEVESSLVESEDGRILLLSIFRETTEQRDVLAALQVSEQHLRLIYDNVKDVIFSIDRKGTVLSLNPEFERRTGWKSSEWIGKSFQLLLHPDDIDIAWKSVYDHLRQRVSGPAELRVRTSRGEYLIGEFTWSLQGLDGTVKSILGTVRDVTHRREAERRTNEERQHLRTLIDNLPDLIYFKDSTGRYVLSNKAHLNSLGLSNLEEALGKTTFDFNPLDLAQQYHADEMRIVQTGGAVLEKEEWALHRDTSQRRLHLTSKIPLLNAEGAVTGIVGISRDITEHKRIQEALGESETKYRNLFQNAVQPMFQTSVEGRFLNANKALLKLLGYGTFFELVDINAGDLYVTPGQREEMKEIVGSKGYVSGLEIQLRRKNGQTVTVLEFSRAQKDDNGHLVGFEGILEDITVRKALEQKLNQHMTALQQSQKELARLNAEKDKLFSVLSHDLRSPFGSILGFCEVLLSDGEALTEAEKKQFVRYIQEGAEDQLSLVNKLLDWSRLEAGRVKIESKEINLGALAAKSVNGLLGLARMKQIHLVSGLPDDLRIQGDEQFIKQVFDNLIGNALKFTPAAGIISLDLVENTKSSIVVSIKDSGIGIPKEDIPKLFKVEEKFTRKGLGGEKGTGLGLSVCMEIMEKHGGTIDVESEVGSGTTFRLTFVNNRPKTEGLTILVVDDEEGARVLHSRYLKRCAPEANIICVSNGRDAISHALRLRPHLVVTDYSMPVMDGFEMLVELKRYAETTRIPVIVVTGDDSRASSEAMMLSGASAVLSKPVVPNELEAKVRSLLGPMLGLS